MSSTGPRGLVHQHNVLSGEFDREKRFGLRLSLPGEDTLRSVLGDGWAKERWFTTELERDRAINELRKQHLYYRLGDRPTLEIEKINRPAGPSDNP